jgi:membrane-bound metal-dependent hydrolase YbcI (DUF457 family)
LTTFVAANVAIDLEPLYHLLRGDYPIHRSFHTVLGATTIGLLTAAAVTFVFQLALHVPSLQAALGRLPVDLRAEFSLSSALIGGAIGGASHSLLDSLVHPDVLPFAPWLSQNPFLGSAHPDALLDTLVATGAVGLVLLLFRAFLIKRAA